MIGNASMLGQIAGFVDSLHLSYDEVVNRIPYRTLLLMSHDKPRPCFGTKIERTSGRDMMARRMAKKQ
jgi:conserved domain protein